MNAFPAYALHARYSVLPVERTLAEQIFSVESYMWFLRFLHVLLA